MVVAENNEVLRLADFNSRLVMLEVRNLELVAPYFSLRT